MKVTLSRLIGSALNFVNYEHLRPMRTLVIRPVAVAAAVDVAVIVDVVVDAVPSPLPP